MDNINRLGPQGMNVEHAEDLASKPAYLRQLRSLGVGIAAAGVAGLLLEPDGSEDDARAVDEE